MRAPVTSRVALLVGLAGASAVLLGAFGAHALRGVLDVRSNELWRTAVDYHAWHALALTVAVALGRGRSRRLAATAFAVGIVLFSGSLYALALGVPRWVGIITPFGGVAFILGWLALGWALRTRDE
ncbi:MULTISPECIES: DUF423 domain-containing protein [Rhodanobacter]|uniref:DUF423 domain-containing protein n=1 Tax=Rhodanobacter TaxID=75309 RepID=UPI00042966F6|nr:MULTISPECIES: DUF423 domain-containing protein [Rhodanobacter]TAN16284.1 MAG: DUF423 domain-containing protein [Rhodanobacter sp.]UJJ54072.1 DUF423 domain-containing protein [Rhodanobacter thiooxydans]